MKRIFRSCGLLEREVPEVLDRRILMAAGLRHECPPERRVAYRLQGFDYSVEGRNQSFCGSVDFGQLVCAENGCQAE